MSTDQLPTEIITTDDFFDKVLWTDVSVRSFSEVDVLPYVNYWVEKTITNPMYDILPGAMGDRAAIEARTIKMLENPDKIGCLVIEVRGKTIGFHTVNNFTDDGAADFHAHFWDEKARGLGLVRMTGVKAAREFMRRFSLTKLFFRPPQSNPMSSTAVRKLPLRFLGQTELNYPILKPGTIANSYEATAEELEFIEKMGEVLLGPKLVNPCYLPIKDIVELRYLDFLGDRFKVRYIYTGSFALGNINPAPKVSDIKVEISEINEKLADLIIELESKIFVQKFRQHFTDEDVLDGVLDFKNYFIQCKPKAVLFWRDERLIGCLLLNTFEVNPYTQTPSIHIGFYGFDPKALNSADEARYIKWQMLEHGKLLNTKNLNVTAAIDIYNMASQNFALKLGLKASALRLAELKK